ncbi:extracellular solute-binding protein, partial [Nesterenkonia sp.]|uniref:molybdate ABC transporter substrate-binding protein n=1 Tax=Nesterenkonia sp. TaxID=704201 RepID=UPI002626C42E
MKSSPRFPGALCAGLLIAAALLSSCARADDEELTVFVAASMHEVMEEIADDFTAETGTSVRLQAAGSATLVEQLSHGADGDVLITADEHWMSKAAEEGLLAGRPRDVAGNEMVLAVPDGNPASVGSLQDVEDDDVDVVVCAPHVPCGRVAEDLLA